MNPRSRGNRWSLACGKMLTVEKSRRYRICLIFVLGVLFLVWIGALIGFLSKGYFLPYKAPASPVAASRRITFDQVISRGRSGSERRFWEASLVQSIEI